MRSQLWAMSLDLGKTFMMRVAAPCSKVFVALVLLSTRAEAASLFSGFEYRSFWSDVFPIILMLIVGIVVTWQFRKKVRQQAASAPPESLRSPQERRLHRLSLPLISAPMIYAIVVDADMVLPFIAVLAAQSVLLVGTRALGLPLGWRLLCILPAVYSQFLRAPSSRRGRL